jgi:DNA repair exonuclease SbcCD ATPase subunit
VTTEHQDVLRKLEAMIEKLENLSVQQQTADPKRQKMVDELITEAQDAVEEIVRWQRRREDESQLVAVIEAIDRNTETFLKAIDKNTKTTNELLVVSEARLQQIEQELSEPDDTAFPVDANILAEGAFLRGQLAGVEDTQVPGPLFKDAPREAIPTGLEVLATAVNNADTYMPYEAS